MFVITNIGIATLKTAPAYAETADGLSARLPGLQQAVLYPDCFTLEDALARAVARLRWLETCQAVTEPRQAQIRSLAEMAQDARQQEATWAHCATELDRVADEIEAGRVPARVDADVEPLLARYADRVIDMAELVAAGAWPDDMSADYREAIEEMRAHAHTARELAASAHETAEQLDEAARLYQETLEAEIQTLPWPPPAIHNAVHDGRHVVDEPECVTIGESAPRRVIWRN